MFHIFPSKEILTPSIICILVRASSTCSHLCWSLGRLRYPPGCASTRNNPELAVSSAIMKPNILQSVGISIGSHHLAFTMALWVRMRIIL